MNGTMLHPRTAALPSVVTDGDGSRSRFSKVRDQSDLPVRRFVWLRELPQRALLAAIAAYQTFVSPALPVITLGACACRFSPTCSHYALEAVRVHGVGRGTWLTLRRLLRCTPLHPGGDDPVPARRPACRAVSRPETHSP